MGTRVFDYPDPGAALIIAAKTASVYLFLIGGLRLLGKRELGQMTIYDLVMIVVLGTMLITSSSSNFEISTSASTCAVQLPR